MRIHLKDKDRLNELLLKNGYTKRSFAKAAKIGEATSAQICNGKRKPSPPIAKRIADTLQVEWEELFMIEKQGVEGGEKVGC